MATETSRRERTGPGVSALWCECCIGGCLHLNGFAPSEQLDHDFVLVDGFLNQGGICHRVFTIALFTILHESCHFYIFSRSHVVALLGSSA